MNLAGRITCKAAPFSIGSSGGFTSAIATSVGVGACPRAPTIGTLAAPSAAPPRISESRRERPDVIRLSSRFRTYPLVPRLSVQPLTSASIEQVHERWIGGYADGFARPCGQPLTESADDGR